MMTRNSVTRYVLPAIAFLFITSLMGCKKFLAVTAPQQISEDEQFSSEQGFKDALTAVYLQMGSADLYGRELTYGMLSVAGRSYDTTMNSSVGQLYYQAAAYNFKDAAVTAAAKNIWTQVYFSIGELNNLLKQMDAHKSVFTGNNYTNIKAEAIALRAFLHFDLLRIFGPAAPAQNLAVQVMPYIKQFSPYAQAYNTTGAVLDSCISDLQSARVLFTDSSVVAGHLNYWGVKALLARVYLYKKDLPNAQSYALQLINTNRFPLATTNADILFRAEEVFNLYVFQNNLFNYLRASVYSTSAPLGLVSNSQKTLYENGSGAAGDYRRLNAFVDPSTGKTAGLGAVPIQPLKLSAYGTGLGTVNNTVMPMIRMTEMYYIAAECAQQINGDFTQATAWLDTVRVHRGLAKYVLTALPTDSITAEISREYMKEMLGEGQPFFYFKRNNTNISTLPFARIPVIANASYVFPKPE